MSPAHHRLGTRIARRLREAAAPQARLAQVVRQAARRPRGGVGPRGTGLSPEANEVASARLENGNRTEFRRLVNPGCSIPLTRIRDQDVRSAPGIHAVQEA